MKNLKTIFSFSQAAKEIRLNQKNPRHPRSIFELFAKTFAPLRENKSSIATLVCSLLLAASFAQTPPLTDHKCATTTDDDKNWNMSRSYDYEGNVIGASIQYSDYRGRPLQSQSYSATHNEVFAAQPVYDEYGRLAIQTLSAPVNNSKFCYKDGFITTSSINYATTNFEGSKLDNPDAVDNSTQGTLGWWYSNNNTDEPYQATTSFPYVRTEYSTRTNKARRVAAPGDELRMGQGREAQTYTMPAAGELYYLFGYAHGWTLNSSGNSLTSPGYQVAKTISIDAEGNESVLFTDRDGRTVASALSGSVNGVNQRTLHVTSIIDDRGYIDIHLPKGCESSLSLYNPHNNIRYQFIDLSNDNIISFGENEYFMGTQPTLSAGYYRISTLMPTIGDDLLAFFPSTSTLYTAQTSFEINYDLNYYEFALNYYDKAGRIIKTIPPLGIATSYSPNPTITNGNSSYRSFYDYNNGFSFSSVSSLDHTTFSISSQVASDEYKEIQLEFRSNLYSDNTFIDQSDILEAALSGNTEGLSTASDGIYYVDAMPEYQSISSSTFHSRAQLGTAFPFNTPKSKNYPDRLPDPLGYSICQQMAEVYEIEFDVFSGNQFGSNPNSPDIASSRRMWIMKRYNKDCQVETIELNGDKFIINTAKITGGISEIVFQVKGLKKIKVNNVGGESPASLNAADYNFLSKYNIHFSEKTHIYGSPTHNMATTYHYNSYGWLLDTESPDEGKVEFTYRRDGQMRFSQNAQQKLENKFSYIHYDALGRPVESGVYVKPETGGFSFQNYTTPSSSSGTNSFLENIFSATNTLADGLNDADCNEQVFSLYDKADNNLATTIGPKLSPHYAQTFVRGAVSKVWDDNSTTWYSYDEMGRQRWVIQKMVGLDTYATIDYSYNNQGGVETVSYQKHEPDERLDHHFTYDVEGSLEKVYTSLDGQYKVEQAAYEYYKNGPLKRTEIAGDLQGMDYVYTLNGQLKSINSPLMLADNDPGQDHKSGGSHALFPLDVFGMSIDYYQNDYKREGTFINAEAGNSSNYNGNIAGVRWNKRTASTDNFSLQEMYRYTYDHQSRLTQANFGTYTHGNCINLAAGQVCSNPVAPSFLADVDENYKVWGTTYDANGNLLSLNRNGYGNASQRTMDQFSYQYATTSSKRTDNRLTHVVDAGDNTDGGRYDDITSQSTSNYVYNAIGQMTDNHQENSHITYNERGLVAVVYGNFGTSNPYKKVEYFYNALGQRSQKVDYENTAGVDNIALKKTWYMRDAGGTVLAVYEEDLGANSGQIEMVEQAVYGSSRLGVYKRPEELLDYDGFQYEFTDHLGNVRSVYHKTTERIAHSIFTDNLDGWSLRSNTSTQYTSGGLKIISSGGGGLLKVFSGLSANTTYTLDIDFSANETNEVRATLLDLVNGSTILLREDHSVAGKVKHTFTTTTATNIAFHIFIRHAGPPPVNGSFTLKEIKIQATDIEILGKTDYYPFGMAMPNKVLNAGSYRYAFQGQERDQESGAQHEFFQLRTWDGRLGRWTSPDPYGQFFSPYNGMGNNPINMIDPDGGWGGTPWIFQVYGKIRKFFGFDEPAAKGFELNEVTLIDPSDGELRSIYDTPQTGDQIGFFKSGSEGSSIKLAMDLSAWFLNNWTPVGPIDDAIVILPDENYTVNEKVNITAAVIFAGAGGRGRGGVSRSIHAGKQGKHIEGHNNYKPGKSVLEVDAQSLLDDFHEGNFQSSRVINETKTSVNFGKPIGNYVKDGVSTPTSVGTVINSKTGVHIVPANPNQF